MQERENILRIFKETKNAIKNDDSQKLSELSNQTINTAARTHDPDNIATAVVVYSIGKVIARLDYRREKGWSLFYRTINKVVDNLIIAIEKNDEDAFQSNVNMFRSAVNKLSGRLRQYIQDVFRNASINKASRLYAHGTSMEETAKLLGITMFDLAEYAGKTGIGDSPENTTIGAKQRIKLAMEIFG